MSDCVPTRVLETSFALNIVVEGKRGGREKEKGERGRGEGRKGSEGGREEEEGKKEKRGS